MSRAQRSNAERRYDAVLAAIDARAAQGLEELTTLARELFDIDWALLALSSGSRHWTASRTGALPGFLDEDTPFCRRARQQSGTLVVEDALADATFAAEPWVTKNRLHFYAGRALRADDGEVLGTLAVLASRAQPFDIRKRRLLEGLARQAEELLRLHLARHGQALAQERSRKFSMLFYNVFDSCRDPIYVRRRNGHFLAANRASYELMNERRENLPEDVCLSNYFPPAVVERLERGEQEAIAQREARNVLLPPIERRQFELTISPLLDEHRRVRGVVSVGHDITAQYRQALLLKVLHQGITDYQALMSGDRLWDFLLRALRELTDSDYALIGEVIEGDDEPALRIHAMTELIWDDPSRRLMEKLRDGDLPLSSAHELLGRVFAGGETVMTDDPYSHPRQEGFPPDVPRLDNYLGVPIYDGEKVIGMYALANGRQGYDETLISWLEPFTATCALLINLYRQFAERERVMAALAGARDEAERASQAKSEFLSAMSHELRTPLNAILGFAQLLGSSRRTPLNARQQRQVVHIETSGKHLLTLINEILDLSRIEAGRLHLSLEDVPLKMAIRDAVETLSASAEKAEVSVEIDTTSPPDMAVSADYTRLKQVLLNLLSNAIKYNARPGRVRIHWQYRRGCSRVTVSDTGPGIPAERFDELFQPFSRLDARHSATEGTGIGLSLTRKLVEHMKGTIGVDSREGQGSDFWFELPLAESDRSAINTSAVKRHAPLRESRGRSIKILHIEDNPASQRLMEEIFLDQDELELQTAPSAELGLELIEHQEIDLILMDVHLPGMDGYQALARLRRDPRFMELPVIALSANAMPGDARARRGVDFTAYLTKPIDIDELLAAVRRALPGRDPA